MADLIHRRDRIVFTAIDVINEMGVQALSTKKIALYEGVSESTVFKYYENKNILLLAVLDYYARYDLDIFESIQLNNKSGEDSIHYYIESFTTYFQNYPAITAITQGLDEMRYNDFLKERVEEIISLRSDCMLELVKKVKLENGQQINAEPKLIVDVIMGTVDGIIRRWRLENYGFPLKERCSQAVGWIIEKYKK